MRPDLLWASPADRIALVLLDTFVQRKFITLFSFLFGLGFAVQLSRARTRGEGFAGFYGRRLTTLALIGAAHSFLFWYGDILLT